ncbi:MAG: Thymidylate synthase [Sclerophora amabilis]|nr:MAG: Thymidylate synthase [Sclerophora amabilis]
MLTVMTSSASASDPSLLASKPDVETNGQTTPPPPPPGGEHEEHQYLNLIRHILKHGELRPDRTGTGTISVFAPPPLKFSLSRAAPSSVNTDTASVPILPLLTTKRVFHRAVIAELLWFISGSTSSLPLSEQGVKIWEGNGSRLYLDSIGLSHREVGDLGPVYGFQWRHFGARYVDAKTDYTGQGVDQLAEVIYKIRTNPYDRRIVLSAWNPADLKLMALPPCHMFAQFYVSFPRKADEDPSAKGDEAGGDRREISRPRGSLHCQLYQRSCDVGLGVPFNIASYALLTHMIAHVCDLTPGTFTHTMGDAHVYVDHVDALTTQLEREPRTFPVLTIKRDPGGNIDGWKAEDFEIDGYEPHKAIAMKILKAIRGAYSKCASLSSSQSPGSPAPFLIYHEEFLNVLGAVPKIELLREETNPLFHEAGVYIPAENALFVTSNLYGPTEDSKMITVTKINLNGAGPPTFEYDIPGISMANGGVNGDAASQSDGDILFCAQGTMTEPSALIHMAAQSPYDTRTVLSNFDGRPFNSLNDVVVHPSDGSIWFTDPIYGSEQGFRPKPQLPNQVYRFDPKSGNVRVVADGFGRPNGISFSPDQKTVYITDTDAIHGDGTVDESRAATIYAFDVLYPPGSGSGSNKTPTLTSRRVFAYASAGVPDGIKCDTAGNVYSGCGDGVHVWNSAGVLIGKITIPATSRPPTDTISTGPNDSGSGGDNTTFSPNGGNDNGAGGDNTTSSPNGGNDNGAGAENTTSSDPNPIDNGAGVDNANFTTGVANFCFGPEGTMFLLNENRIWKVTLDTENVRGALLGI